MFQYRVNIWLEYYGELLKHVIITNPPRFLGAVFKIMSLILPEKVMDRFTFAQNSTELTKILHISAIPIEYKGSRTFPEADYKNGCYKPKEVTKDDYLIDGLIWQENHITGIKYDNLMVNSSESYVKTFDVKKGQKLFYEFSTNRDFEFCVFTDQSHFLHPRFKMITPVLAEEGIVMVLDDGKVTFEIKNLSKMMKMKLKIATQLMD
ncbi:unnamed protein product [Bursaphelenchus okinawaensis]|uniref:CRAL-TRIO domain-containing protein n=1 Tax=Bursaphelenchus okinawaensis TaxID=465554 RepID=A0A811KMW5_9BILA|nr:unnamed protein product [Bursaphelenchus okinawaensis]CAG9106415.1 unnamed protein product [Bursaphelenchus okinawaensis]